MIAAGAPAGLKRYVVRRVGPDGRREIVADTALLSEARAFPALLDGVAPSGGRRRGVRPGASPGLHHESVEAATGRVVYPEPGPADAARPPDPNTRR